MWSTHRLLLRSDLWWRLSKRGKKDSLLNQAKLRSPTYIFPALIKSWLAYTSRDSFKFCQLLSKSDQARFMQHDLFHKGIEQGELFVSATELWNLWTRGQWREWTTPFICTTQGHRRHKSTSQFTCQNASSLRENVAGMGTVLLFNEEGYRPAVVIWEL